MAITAWNQWCYLYLCDEFLA